MTESNWPTDEQFDKATELGCNAALAERRNGNEEPQESPLSGEWADAPTSRSIAESLGFTQPDDDEHHHEWVDGLDELGTAWERGYFDTWTHETAVKAEEDAE